jgi:transposase
MPAETGILFSEFTPTLKVSGSSPAPLASIPVAQSVPVAQPRFKVIDRKQTFFRCVDVEALIDEDHSARAIWSVVDKCDLKAFHEQTRVLEGAAGRSAMNPHLLVSLWIYAYSQGVGSAREISRLCVYHPAYQWLTGVEKISGHTLSSFRVEHKEALEKLFIDVVGVLSAEGFVNLKRVMLDGTKVRANAAADSFRKQETLQQHLEDARQQCAALAQTTDDQNNEVRKQARKRGTADRLARLGMATEQIQQLGIEASADDTVRASSSDPEARKMKQPDGGFAPSYNVQTTTSAKGKAIVSLDVTQAGNDFEQLQPALERLERTLGSKPEQVVVDGGYISRANILETATTGVELIGPVQSTEAKAAQGYTRTGVKPEFYGDQFRLDAEANCLYCPMGKRLGYQGKTKSDLIVIHKYQARPGDCAACERKVDCCPKNEKTGRSVQRSEYHQEIKDFRQQMEKPETKQIYRQRSEVAETPHLWMKTKFNLRQFHVRGLAKVAQEALWAALTYNISLLIRYRKKALA